MPVRDNLKRDDCATRCQVEMGAEKKRKGREQGGILCQTGGLEEPPDLGTLTLFRKRAFNEVKELL